MPQSEKELFRQLTNLRVSYTETGQMQIKHSQDYQSDDFAMAFAMALMATNHKVIPEHAYQSKAVDPKGKREIPAIPQATRLFRALTGGSIEDGGGWREPKPEMKAGRRKFPNYMFTADGKMTRRG